MNKWEVMGHSFEDMGDLLRVECENMATNCSFDPGFEQMYEHYEIMLRTLTTQHRLIQNAFNMLDARFSAAAESAAQLAEDLEDHQTERIKGLW
jgi:tRNA-dihydrouridine synthase